MALRQVINLELMIANSSRLNLSSFYLGRRAPGTILFFFLTVFFSSGRAYAQHDEVWDPIEPVNRGIFWFNDQADIYVFEPVSRGYDYVVPRPAQNCVDNFFKNIRSPIYLVSDIFQLKFGQAATHTGRFLINTTLGIAGLFEVADKFGLKYHYEDFGVMLGYWGLPPGPYLVIPLLGPSNLRDGFGRIVDAFLNPTFYAGQVTDTSGNSAVAISGGLYLFDSINTRARLLDAIRSAKDASLDYYSFVQATYGQLRLNYIYDDYPPQSSDPLDSQDPMASPDDTAGESQSGGGGPESDTGDRKQTPQTGKQAPEYHSPLAFDFTKELP